MVMYKEDLFVLRTGYEDRINKFYSFITGMFVRV